MTPPAIRRAVVADTAALLPHIIELYRLEQLRWKPEEAPAALARLLASPDLGFVLTADDPAGGLAGYAICTFGYDLEYSGRDAILTELFVAAPWRGHHLGRLLIEAVERDARAAGVHAIHLVVRKDNEPALALYDSRGWAVVPRHFMTKKL